LFPRKRDTALSPKSDGENPTTALWVAGRGSLLDLETHENITIKTKYRKDNFGNTLLKAFRPRAPRHELCSGSTSRALISLTDGIPRFRNMITRGSMTDSSPSGRRRHGRRNRTKVPRVEPKMNAVQGSIVVNAPIGSVYQHWLRLEHLPKFITAVKQVKKLDANHFLLAVSHKGQRYEGVLEIILRVPERRLVWRVVARNSSSHHFATGVVSFSSQSDRSTGVSIQISSSFTGAVSRRLNPYLRNFKRLIEKPARA
jgi:hypothetical protein